MLKQTGLTGTPLYADIVNCKMTWDNDPSTLNNPRIPLSGNRHSTCAHSERTSPKHFTAPNAEILALSQAAWLNVIIDNLSTIQSNLVTQVATPCANYCAKFMEGPKMFNTGGVSSSSALNQSLLGNIGQCAQCGMQVTGTDQASFPATAFKNGCPVTSPYEPAASENDLTFGTLTQKYGSQDAGSCADQCYANGVTGGYIALPGGTHAATASPGINPPIPFYVARQNIPPYWKVIQTFLAKQWPLSPGWPQNPSQSTQSCALNGPVQ